MPSSIHSLTPWQTRQWTVHVHVLLAAAYSATHKVRFKGIAYISCRQKQQRRARWASPITNHQRGFVSFSRRSPSFIGLMPWTALTEVGWWAKYISSNTPCKAYIPSSRRNSLFSRRMRITRSKHELCTKASS